MKTSPTDTVLRAEAQCRAVEASFKTHRETVGSKLTEHFARFAPEGSTPVDYREVLDSMRFSARDIRVSLVRDEQEFLDAKARRSELYQEARGATTVARRQILDFKSSIEGIHGEESHSTFGIAGTVPSAPIPVLRQGQRVYDLLEAPEKLKLTEAKKVGAKMDFAEAREQLGPKVADLQEKVSAYDDGKRLAEQALEQKRQSIARYRRELRSLVRTGEGYYRLVGEDEAADRLRLASRKRAVKEEPAPEPEATPPETPESAPEDGGALLLPPSQNEA